MADLKRNAGMTWHRVSDRRGASRLAQFVVLWTLFIAVLPAQSIAQTLTTIAGGGIGDGTAATEARLNNPSALFVDGTGGVYVVDTGHHRVRWIDPSGEVTTVAGTGSAGFGGDGGRAIEADLNRPTDLFIDGSGNLYILDTGNQRVRVVDTSGLIITVAGNGEAGYSGDGGPAAYASLNEPTGITMGEDGALYIADQGNHRIRRVNPSGEIEAVAGNGVEGAGSDGLPALESPLMRPTDVAVDPDGRLLFLEAGRGRIRRVDGSGLMSTVLDATVPDAILRRPDDLFVDPTGKIIVTDGESNRIVGIAPDGRTEVLAGASVRGFAGDGGPATWARLNDPSSPFVDSSGNLYFADRRNHRIRRVDPRGVIETVAGGGVGDGGVATSAHLINPFGLAVDKEGNLYIADTSNQRIRKVDSEGRITTVAGRGSYGFSGDGGPATEAMLASPMSVCVGPDGIAYIADTFNHRIRRVDPEGIISSVAGRGSKGVSGDGGPATEAQLNNPTGIFVDLQGVIYVADQANHRIRKIDPTGIITTAVGSGQKGFSGDGGPATLAMLADPFGVTVNLEGELFIADRSNYRIRKVDREGRISTVAGDGLPGFSGDGGAATSARLRIPSAVFSDPFGQVFFVDRGNNRVRRIDPSGRITTVVGGGAKGFSGDGEAVQSLLAGPFGLSLDGSGTLYIADTENHRVRRVLAPERSIQIWKDKGAIDADGQETLTIHAELLPSASGGVEDPRVAFHILEGNGTLSLSSVMASSGSAETTIKSRTPGRITVQASAIGAWGVTASLDVKAIRSLAASADPLTISANGFDTSVLALKLLDLDGSEQIDDSNTEVHLRVVGGEGRLQEEVVRITHGEATARFFGLEPGLLTILASAPGAAARYVVIRVTEPLPGQLPDLFEPDDVRTVAKSIGVDGKVQMRTLHTVDETDWVSFEAMPGYRYAITAGGEGNLQIQVHDENGEPLDFYENDGEFVFDRSRKETLYLSVKAMDNRQGMYRLSVQAHRSARLEIATDLEIIAGDGSDFATLEVSLLSLDGTILDEDNEIRVAFQIVEGQGQLTADEGVVGDGRVTTTVTTGESGEVVIQASAAGMEPVRLAIVATPAIVLRRIAAPHFSGAPGDLVAVNLLATSGTRGIVGFRAGLGFDPSQLEFVGFEVEGLMQAGRHLISRPGEGQVEIHAAILGGTASADRGSLGQATFRVLEGFEGKTELRLVSGSYGGLSGTQELKIGAEQGTLVVEGTQDPITISDFQTAFGASAGDLAFDDRMDLDGNGNIGFSDLLLFIAGLEGSAE